MNKSIFILSYLLFLTFGVCGQNTLHSSSSFLTDSNLENRYKLVSETFKDQVSMQKLEAVLSSLDQMHGELTSFKLEKYFSNGVNDYAYYSCVGSITTANYKFVINRYTGLINGFFIVDALPKDEYIYPEYIKSEKVKDSLFTFQSDNLNFIAKMTYPSKKRRRGLRKKEAGTIVFLAGSGPSRIDGGINANQTYNELSVGLSQFGYNFVQFNKRSSFNQNIENNASVQQEYYSDVKALIKVLNEAGHSDIIILGHSLGGYLGAQLLADDNLKIKGFISLSSPNGNVLDLLEDQITRLHQTKGYGEGIGLVQSSQLTEDIVEGQISFIRENHSDEVLDSIVLGAPISYWKELDAFNMETFLTTNSIPKLVILGQHDFQIPIEERNKWVEKYSNTTAINIELIPDMNHFLVIQPEDDNPTFYKQKSAISRQCLNEINTWIKKID